MGRGSVSGAAIIRARPWPERPVSEANKSGRHRARTARRPHLSASLVMVSAVEVSDLTVRFDHVTALDGVTHTFEPGTATAVMGVNGSGKTTMLECLAGLQKPTSGQHPAACLRSWPTCASTFPPTGCR